ncbi:hypothetical protein [Rhizobium johnstonii]|uniref:hypothetical protein n=1 Tax=Rhizobium johnstonii TaxID=3019933 RepID=UPI003F97E50F
MTVKDTIRPELYALFQVDEDAVDALPDDILLPTETILNFIEGLRESLDRVFTEDGESFIQEIQTAFGQLASVDGVDIDLLLPNSANLMQALRIANAITDEQLDAEMPANYLQFRLDEDMNSEGIYDSSGTSVTHFFYQHQGDLLESVCYLDFSDLNAGLEAADLDNSSQLNIIAVSLLSRTEEVARGKRWIISCCDHVEGREVLLKYHALLCGYLLTRPVYSPLYDGIDGIPATLRRGGSYAQFREPFAMLSEFNSRKTIIDSFLSAYHTLENYMVRARIVAVERAHNGATFFSIRDFKRMHAAIDQNEGEQLRLLFRDCWNLQIGGTTFGAYVDIRINHLVNGMPQGFQSPELANFLQKLGAPGDFTVANENERRKTISKLVYQIRCSIVHNKETEYHISNRELQNSTNKLVLTELCIPIMRRLAFGLPSVVQENPITYSRREIALY